jgi:hypothetical protein
MRNVLFRRKRPVCAHRTILTALAFVLASHIHPALAQVSAQPETPIFTIIVTRHGVRAISPPKHDANTNYAWPDWSEVGPKDEPYLTRHGYRLMRLMGKCSAAWIKARNTSLLPSSDPNSSTNSSSALPNIPIAI